MLPQASAACCLAWSWRIAHRATACRLELAQLVEAVETAGNQTGELDLGGWIVQAQEDGRWTLQRREAGSEQS